MEQTSPHIPAHPKLRPVEPQWVDYQGQRFLYLRDPLGMAQVTVLVPQVVAPLLAYFDGAHDVSAMQSVFALRTGVQLPTSAVHDLVSRLDEALLLENGAFKHASRRALQEYRDAPYRPMSHAGAVYPESPDALKQAFAEYGAKASQNGEPLSPSADLRGILCPHIDYHRGHKTYADLWRRATPALDDVEVAVILGTDHSGGAGMLTPTRQSYASPLGVLPTDQGIVDGLAEVLGQDRAFTEELHHVREHSIEMAAVWLHYSMGGRPCPVVPVLCGSFHHFVTGDGEPEDDSVLEEAVGFLREAIAGRRALVIAAGDLAHVGPAFGDAYPLDQAARDRLKDEDEASIAAICRGDAREFLERSRRELDARRICGLSSIYFMLRLLDGVRGDALGYDQCPADIRGGSFVSIAGALLYRDSPGG